MRFHHLLNFAVVLVLCSVDVAFQFSAKSSFRSSTSSRLSSAYEKYCLNVDINVDPSRRQDFLQSIKDNQKGSLTDEIYCLQYTWGESETTPNTFHFHEEFIGKDGFELHTKSPHFKAWETFAQSTPTPFTKDPEVKFYKTLIGGDKVGPKTVQSVDSCRYNLSSTSFILSTLPLLPPLSLSFFPLATLTSLFLPTPPPLSHHLPLPLPLPHFLPYFPPHPITSFSRCCQAKGSGSP